MRSKFSQINETKVKQESEEECKRRPKGIHRKASQWHRKRRFQDMQTLYRITMYRRIHQVSIQRLAMRWTPTGKRNRGRPTETWTRLAQEPRKQQDMHWTNCRKQDHWTIVAYLHVLYDRSTTVTLCKIRIINS